MNKENNCLSSWKGWSEFGRIWLPELQNTMFARAFYNTHASFYSKRTLVIITIIGALLQSFDLPGQHFSFRAAQHPTALVQHTIVRGSWLSLSTGIWSELARGPLLCLILLITLCWPLSKPSEPCNGSYRCEQQKEEYVPHFSAAAMLFSEARRDAGESGDAVNPCYHLVPITWRKK